MAGRAVYPEFPFYRKGGQFTGGQGFAREARVHFPPIGEVLWLKRLPEQFRHILYQFQGRLILIDSGYRARLPRIPELKL
jgi:hypothetical protein